MKRQMVSPLSDGNPLTYDWLNLLASELKDATDMLSSNKKQKKFNFFTNTKGTKTASTVQFLTGTQSITVKDGKGEAKVTFSPAFAMAGVVVFAQINSSADMNFVGIVTPTQINKNSCVLKIQQYGKASSKSLNISVNYLAIGSSVS